MRDGLRIEDRGLRGGYTLIEATISTLIVGVTLVASLHAVTVSRLGLQHVGEQGRGMLLAQDLLAEIMEQAYADAAYGLGSVGLGSDEIGDGSRALWDDVDDYDGWQASPPQSKDGTELTWAPDYERSVEVVWVEPTDFNQVAADETGIKRITVTVKHEGSVVAQLVALRTAGWAVSATRGGLRELTRIRDIELDPIPVSGGEVVIKP